MKRILAVSDVVLALLLAATWRYASVQRGERVRLMQNQNVLLAESREYKVRDSLNAVSVGVLTMKADELRRGFEDMAALVRDLNIKFKRVESLSLTSLESTYVIAAGLRDTIVPVNVAGSCGEEAVNPAAALHGGYRRAQAIRFRDAHMELDGLVLDSMFYGSVVIYDTLTQVVHRVPRRFLFFRWGTKELRQEIVSSNPHTRITYSRSIKVRK